VLSIITNISLDHTHLLGNTPEIIAFEKAGIMKSGVPVLIGEAEDGVKDVFIRERERIRSRSLLFAPPLRSASLLSSGRWVFETDRYPRLIGELGGYAQEKNAATVLCAIEILGRKLFTIPAQAVYRGFRQVVKNTGLEGRWQVVQRRPKIVLDTAHNVGGMQYIVRQLQEECCNRLHIVFGMVNDKDISSVLALLPPHALYYFTQASIPRALDAGSLAEQAAQFGLRGDVFPSVAEAFLSAKQNATEKDFIFAGGSTFVVSDVLKEIQSKK
jgi:dihydrofolate synthase/folylpolyglutamate synthase